MVSIPISSGLSSGMSSVYLTKPKPRFQTSGRDRKGEERAKNAAEELIEKVMTEHAEKPVELQQDGVIIHKSDTLEQYSEKVNKIKDYKIGRASCRERV